MKPALAQKLYSQGKVLFENPTAEPDQDVWPMARTEFLYLITSLTQKEDIGQALDTLLKIAQGEITQNIPAELEELVAELESVEEKKAEAREGAMRKVRELMVRYRLQREGVTTETPRFAPEERESAVTRVATNVAPNQPPATNRPTGETLQRPERLFPARAPQTGRVSLTITKPGLPIPAAITHFVASLPARAVKLTLDLGRDALAKADPNVQTFVLLWREGITSQAIKTALEKGAAGISQEAVETLKTQADQLEAYEKSHPVLTNLLTFLHRAEDIVVTIKDPASVTRQEARKTIDLILNTGQRTISGITQHLPPAFVERLVGSIFNNPLTRLFASPFKALSANFLSGLKIATIRAPVTIGNAIFPGGGPSFAPSLQMPSGAAWAPARGAASTVATGAGIGITRLAGAGVGAVGGMFGAAGGIIGGLGAVGGAISAGGAAVVGVATSTVGLGVLIIGGAIALPIILTIININGYQGAFLVKARTPGSIYISIEKNAFPKTDFSNSELPQTVRYAIRVVPRRGPLKDVEIKDVITRTNKDGTETIGGNSWTAAEIASPWSQTYTFDLTSDAQDSLIVNTVTVTATVADQTSKQVETTSRTIVVGNPPQDCPSGWPVTAGIITQGPNGATSHRGKEAIDIGGGIAGEFVYSTHRGKVRAGQDSTMGRYVELTTSCNGQTITTRYMHMSTLSEGIETGAEVSKRTVLGTVGCTGFCFGPHVHYDFIGGIKMEPPFVPKSIPDGCDGEGSCAVSIP